MKKMFRCFAVALSFIATLGLTACNNGGEEAGSIGLSATNLTFGYNDTGTEKITVTGADWSATTSDHWIILSQTEGMAGSSFTIQIALNEGSTREGHITVGDQAGNARSKIITVTQYEEIVVPVSEVSLNHSRYSFEVGNELELSATVLPADATMTSLRWSSSDPNVATVSDGLVKGVGAGVATITATSIDGSDLSAGCLLTVKTPPTISACFDDDPSWVANLGTIGFVTDRIWVVGDQEWSDAVVASGSRSELPATDDDPLFFGGDWWLEGMYRSDARTNNGMEGESGDLFSWAAVAKYRDHLCPDGWRVPDSEDFRELNIALGGQDVPIGNDYIDVAMFEKYQNEWGAVLGGICNNWIFQAQDMAAVYWAVNEYDEQDAYEIEINSRGIGPRYYWGKNYGCQVRCVR